MEIRRCMKCMHALAAGETVCPECGRPYGSVKAESFALKPLSLIHIFCIKDMAGIMGPKEAYDLVSAIKDAAPELPIDLHTHSTTGLAFMTYLKAVEAGVDIIDLSLIHI